MDRSVWATAKAQLHLFEATHVKETIGRQCIRRNKDALRELRCLQEILMELHAGELSCAPPESRGAVEAAGKRWPLLVQAAKDRSVGGPEDLCEVPVSVLRFLRARSVAGAEGGGSTNAVRLYQRRSCDAEEASSTRTPSTFAPLEADARSVTTIGGRSECASGDAAALLHVTPAPGGRLTAKQLEDMAVGLREQLEQEFTSIMSSIDEVQALLDAEMAGAKSLPSRAELCTFIAAADAALTALPWTPQSLEAAKAQKRGASSPVHDTALSGAMIGAVASPTTTPALVPALATANVSCSSTLRSATPCTQKTLVLPSSVIVSPRQPQKTEQAPSCALEAPSACSLRVMLSIEQGTSSAVIADIVPSPSKGIEGSMPSPPVESRASLVVATEPHSSSAVFGCTAVLPPAASHETSMSPPMPSSFVGSGARFMAHAQQRTLADTYSQTVPPPPTRQQSSPSQLPSRCLRGHQQRPRWADVYDNDDEEADIPRQAPFAADVEAPADASACPALSVVSSPFSGEVAPSSMSDSPSEMTRLSAALGSFGSSSSATAWALPGVLSPSESTELEGSEPQRPSVRPRWADVCDEVSDEDVASSATTRDKERGLRNAPATAECCVCRQSLSRLAFSRRAWREARMLGGRRRNADGDAPAASCLACRARGACAVSNRASLVRKQQGFREHNR
eukprot:TRINITY_DN44524_c0_g1_i1.p1 TRINITY_DN44524_c0_g1~~TRINITY_DN44524_c0_g1_i1.p1  ORF type:complete len:696 (-),score=95.72 TRINITY_DN44524_c0_g1_i1:27-2072(-)